MHAQSSHLHAIGAPLFLFIAWLLLLLVSVSVPIAKSIYLFAISANISISILVVKADANASVRFGVWGFCFGGLHLSALTKSENVDPHCSAAALGYRIDNTVSDDLHVASLVNAISRTLTAGLALYIVACILSFIALALSLLAIRRRSPTLLKLTSAVSLLAALFSTVAFAIGFGLTNSAHKHVSQLTDGIANVTVGNALWLTLSAMICLFAATLLSCYAIRQTRNAAKF